MNHITYFLAGVYQSIKKRRPDGTPYFNLTLLLTFLLFLHFMQLLVVFKIEGIIILPYSDKACFLMIGITSICVFFGIRYMFPIEIISEVEITEQNRKRANLAFMLYFFGSITLLMFLLFKLHNQVY